MPTTPTAHHARQPPKATDMVVFLSHVLNARPHRSRNTSRNSGSDTQSNAHGPPCRHINQAATATQVSAECRYTHPVTHQSDSPIKEQPPTTATIAGRITTPSSHTEDHAKRVSRISRLDVPDAQKAIVPSSPSLRGIVCLQPPSRSHGVPALPDRHRKQWR
jgi:hypothetical protein